MRLQPCPINSFSGGTLFIWQDRILTYKDGPHAERVITYIFLSLRTDLENLIVLRVILWIKFMDQINGSNKPRRT